MSEHVQLAAAQTSPDGESVHFCIGDSVIKPVVDTSNIPNGQAAVVDQFF